jgi:hypothetical protein
MTVKISPNLTRTSDGIDYKTGKNIRKIFHPDGRMEVWELDAANNPIRKIQ